MRKESLTRSDSLKKAYAEGRHRRVSSDIVKKGWEKRSRFVSAETRLKRSISLKKAWDEGRHSKFCGNAGALKRYHEQHGWEVTDEVRRRISDARKGIRFTDLHRKNLSLSHVGRRPVMWFYAKGFKHSDEARKNMSDAQKERFRLNPVSEESRIKMSISRRNEKSVLNARKNIVEILKRRESFAEKKIRSQLEDAKIIFERQYVVNDGEFIYDFLIGDNKLVECDSFYWHRSPKMISQDHKKTQWAKNNGFSLVRFDENDVKKDDFSILKVM